MALTIMAAIMAPPRQAATSPSNLSLGSLDFLSADLQATGMQVRSYHGDMAMAPCMTMPIGDVAWDVEQIITWDVDQTVGASSCDVD